MRAETALFNLCDWVRRANSPQQAAARYRSALRRDWIELDSDYAALSYARATALQRLALARELQRR